VVTARTLPIIVNAAGTALFALTATYAAVVFDTTAQWTGSITALALFSVGVFAFLWAFWNALQRSRTESVAVTQLYLLAGPAIPSRIRWSMNSLLAAQGIIAMITTLVRPNGPDGSPGSSLAVGFLVPMFGFGMNGLWAAYHGRFQPRCEPGVEPGVLAEHPPALAQGAIEVGVDGPPVATAGPTAADRALGSIGFDRASDGAGAVAPDADNSRLGGRIGQNAPMAETASEFTTIDASLEEIWAVVVDVERYPHWAHDVKQATIIESDDEGRPLLVDFVASALGRSTHYSLRYDYSAAPESVSWAMEKGDIQREITGAYQFSANPGGGTDVQYDVIIELVVPLPGFVKRRAEVRILNTLKELKARVEAQ
jgi:uncharacterized membrane protein